MSAAILRTVRGFAAWGHQYNSGDPIPAERVALWAPGTLETRIENGDVTYDAASPEEAAHALLGSDTGVVLVAVKHFSAFGIEYHGGDIIESEDHAKWPEGTVLTRLTGGDVKYMVDPSIARIKRAFAATVHGNDDASAADAALQALADEKAVPPVDPELLDEDDEEPFDIATATKARMVSYAKSEFNADLSVALDKPSLKAQLQALIDKAATPAA